jgi:lipoprotein-anchoring transpeptidase ErfK/SrfK
MAMLTAASRMRAPALAFVAVLGLASPALADVVARVSIASQRMVLIVDGEVEAVWKVSTAGRGYHTPRGSYRPKVLRRMHYSSKYENAPMPHSVFFRGGYAVHGTDHVRSLGRPVSHGCIRLAPRNAATLYHLIRQHGIRATRIIIG